MGNRIANFICLMLACVMTVGCKDKPPVQVVDLTTGYWLREDDPQEPLMRFDEEGRLFFYVYTVRTGTEDCYDAYYDVSAKYYTRYAIDIENGRICFLPGMWYDLLVLTDEVLTLGDDQGNGLRYVKLSDRRVNVMSREDFYDRYPDFVPENRED